MWKQMLQEYDSVDYIVRGEGEETLFELVQGTKLAEIKGLSWKNKTGKVISNPDRLPIQNLDSLPYPAWDLIDPNAYPARGEGIYNDIDLTKVTRYSIIFSRGCMACCTFCSSWKIWEGYRYRSGMNVAR
jgi:anaerobic magnesium-protoporphyrin IX monomethyl ester cyclase